MNILYVTISNWGVGDELALMGTLMLTEKVWPGHNKFYADKNFEIQKDSELFYSDIWIPSKDIPIDLVVHAGGNGWSGPEHSPWNNFIVNNNIPVVYLGVGMARGEDKNHPVMKEVMERCLLFAGRDHVSVSMANKLGCQSVVQICCPSLFIRKKTSRKCEEDRVGLVFQYNGPVLPHSCKGKELYESEVELFRNISESKDTHIICHFIGDYEDAIKAFPDYADRAKYSRSISDYINWYSECSSIISMRLHGGYLGAALDKPTTTIKYRMSKMCALPVIGVPVSSPQEMNVSNYMTYLSDPEATKILKRNYYNRYMSCLKGIDIPRQGSQIE